jgi:hypothetical protein
MPRFFVVTDLVQRSRVASFLNGVGTPSGLADEKEGGQRAAVGIVRAERCRPVAVPGRSAATVRAIVGTLPCSLPRGARQRPICREKSPLHEISKTVSGLWVRRGFKSLPLRFTAGFF